MTKIRIPPLWEWLCAFHFLVSGSRPKPLSSCAHVFFLHHCSWCKWCSRAMSGLQISINTKPMMMRLPTCNIIALSRVLEWKCLSSKRHDSAKSPTISSDMRKTYRYVARRTERKTSCRKRGGFICHRFWYYHYLFGIQRDCTSIENDKKKKDIESDTWQEKKQSFPSAHWMTTLHQSRGYRWYIYMSRSLFIVACQ